MHGDFFFFFRSTYGKSVHIDWLQLCCFTSVAASFVTAVVAAVAAATALLAVVMVTYREDDIAEELGCCFSRDVCTALTPASPYTQKPRWSPLPPLKANETPHSMFPLTALVRSRAHAQTRR